MRFWDTSALLPLFVDEAATDACRHELSQDPHVAVWEATSVELLSALARYRRTSSGTDDLLFAVRHEILERWPFWTRVADWASVTRRAHRLVSVHPLKAADAMQLAAALVACDDRPQTLPLVTRDRQLSIAGQLEGFRVTLL